MDIRIYERYARRMRGVERVLFVQLNAQYRRLRLALLDALNVYDLGNPGLAITIDSLLSEMESVAARINRESVPSVDNAVRRYTQDQIKQAQRVKLPVSNVYPPGVEQMIETGMLDTEWIGTVRARLLSELNRLKTSGETKQVVIDRLLSTTLKTGRVSAWRAGRSSMELATQLALWTAANGAVGYAIDTMTGEGQDFQRQAIAAIDERTTDCCLRVHGQVVGMNEPFHLTGTPRFADDVIAPPFHWNCRTATMLYMPEMDEIGITTGEMRDAANSELKAREETDKRVEIHPAHALSRR